MEKVHKFIECALPVTVCNLECSYCYVIQRHNRSMQMPKLKYSPELIGKGLSKARWGGTCYFSICGAGETLIPKESVEIAAEILKQGHFVNITTNGTLSKRFDELVALPEEHRQRIHIAFSFHYLELVRTKLLNTFFDNVDKVRDAGCSFLVQINLCDEYIEQLEEIKRLCLARTGALPQVAATRKENNLTSDIEFLTNLPLEKYLSLGREVDSPLFEFTMRNFNVRQGGFCYAGDWTGQLDLGTGMLSRCYGSVIRQDIFRDTKKPIDFCAVGRHCGSLFCMNSSHFLSLGAIPDAYQDVTYAGLRNRRHAGWYSSRMDEFLSSKLIETNRPYAASKRIQVQLYALYEFTYKHLAAVKRSLRKRGRDEHAETAQR